jgi:hypothetical protein
MQLWTDEKSREFIATEYPWFIDTFDNYPHPIQRADAIRYFVLAHFGGVYLDLDDVSNSYFSNSSLPPFDSNSTCCRAATEDLIRYSPTMPGFAVQLQLVFLMMPWVLSLNTPSSSESSNLSKRMTGAGSYRTSPLCTALVRFSCRSSGRSICRTVPPLSRLEYGF